MKIWQLKKGKLALFLISKQIYQEKIEKSYYQIFFLGTKTIQITNNDIIIIIIKKMRL